VHAGSVLLEVFLILCTIPIAGWYCISAMMSRDESTT
jgi:hypothetical protein